jgi:hypothetical protein
MGKNLFILTIFVLVVIAIIIWMIKKNHEDRKSLFKKNARRLSGSEKD